jgi:hypothetical protein
MWRDVLDLEAHHVAATQLAIDREIEERQVPLRLLGLESCGAEMAYLSRQYPGSW